VEAIKVDNRGIFVQRGGTRIFELSFDPSSYAFDYTSTQLSALIPEIGQPGISRLGLQRQIDSIVHAVRTDGICADMLYDKVEQVNCWYTTQSDGASGTIEDIVILPASSTGVEDQVYFQTKRTVNGSTVRFLEKQALDSECTGLGQTCKLADAHIVFTNAPASATVTGLTSRGPECCRVGGREVPYRREREHRDLLGRRHGCDLAHQRRPRLYGDHRRRWASPTPRSGRAGSSRSCRASAAKTLMSDQMVITKLSVIAANLHAKGITYGRDFTNLDDLPGYEGANDPVASDDVRTSYDESPFALEGQWSQDERICLQAQAPRPATVIAAIAEVELAA
jgi:hypothetical protein